MTVMIRCSEHSKYCDNMPRLILASASPQRKTLLSGLELRFEVIPSTVDEDIHPEQDPALRAVTLAKLKALDVSGKHPGATIIGCDTLVVAADGTLLEKPKDEEDARRMLMLQNGRTSLVHSAVCIVDAKGKTHEGLSTSSVLFKKLTEKEIDWWINTKLWQGRSGGFQIDGLGQLMIASITGDWTGIVGLPVFLLGQLLEDASYLFE